MLQWEKHLLAIKKNKKQMKNKIEKKKGKKFVEKKKIVICLRTKHLGVLENSLKRVRGFQIELEFGIVGF